MVPVGYGNEGVEGGAWSLESDCLVLELAPPIQARYLTPLFLFLCNMRVSYSTHLTEMLGELSELIV